MLDQPLQSLVNRSTVEDVSQSGIGDMRMSRNDSRTSGDEKSRYLNKQSGESFEMVGAYEEVQYLRAHARGGDDSKIYLLKKLGGPWDFVHLRYMVVTPLLEREK